VTSVSLVGSPAASFAIVPSSSRVFCSRAKTGRGPGSSVGPAQFGLGFDFLLFKYADLSANL
jgi:hypothetical protein